MSSPFSYVDAPRLIGSWPILPTYNSGGQPSVLPRTLTPRARILGIAPETLTGFAVGGKSFIIKVNGVSKTISFPAGGPYTLDEVIGFINSLPPVGAGMTLAYRDNKFLLLQSPEPVAGTDTLSVDVAPASDPTTLQALGLFAGVEGYVGQVSQAPSTEPDRQQVLPGQLLVAEGEAFNSESVNRAAFQVAINADVHHGLLLRKRQAKTEEMELVNPGSGFTLSTTIFTGWIPNPTEDELEKVIVLLDANGNDVLVDVTTTPHSGLLFTFTYDTDLKEQRVWWSYGSFDPAWESGNYYVKASGSSLGPLDGVPLKILRVIDENNAVVSNIDPVTGGVVQLNDTISDCSVILVTPTHARPSGLWTSAAMTPPQICAQNYDKCTATIDSVGLNNRIVCLDGAFIDDGVVEGDEVEISGHSITLPFCNDGIYRVSRVIGPQELELVSEDSGPVFLSPSGELGTIVVRTDGAFYKNPYVSLNIPVPNGTYRLLYKSLSNLSGILDDVDSVGGSLLEYTQQNSYQVEQTLKAVLGPSVASFDDYLHDDHRISLESLEYRMDLEHNEVGRHTTIRPDVIDMETNVAGITFKLRNDSSEDLDYATKKFVHYDSAGNILAAISAVGDYNAYDPYTGYWGQYYGGGLYLSRLSTGESTWVMMDVSPSWPMLFMYSEDHGADINLNSLDPYGSASLAASGDGEFGLGYVQLYGAYQAETFGAYEAGSYVEFGSGANPFVRWTVGAKANSKALTFSCPYSQGGYNYRNLMYLIRDVKGAAVGIGYDQTAAWSTVADPGYLSSTNARSSLLDVFAADREWPIRITRRSLAADKLLRNSFLAIRELRDGSNNPLAVTNGTVLGGLAMGGRYHTDAGDFSTGKDGGCEIIALANEDWAGTSRGSYLQFLTSTAGHDHADLRAELRDTGLQIWGNGLFDYNGTPTTLTIGSTSASSHQLRIIGTSVGAGGVADVIFGEETYSNRYALSLRGDSEDGGVNSFRFLYYGSGWYDVWRSVPTAAAANTYDLYLHNTDFRITNEGHFQFDNDGLIQFPRPQVGRMFKGIPAGYRLDGDVQAHGETAVWAKSQNLYLGNTYSVRAVVPYKKWLLVFQNTGSNVLMHKVRRDQPTLYVESSMNLPTIVNIQRNGALIVGNYLVCVYQGVYKFRLTDFTLASSSGSSNLSGTGNDVATDGTHIYVMNTRFLSGPAYYVALTKFNCYPNADTAPLDCGRITGPWSATAYPVTYRLGFNGDYLLVTCWGANANNATWYVLANRGSDTTPSVVGTYSTWYTGKGVVCDGSYLYSINMDSGGLMHLHRWLTSPWDGTLQIVGIGPSLGSPYDLRVEAVDENCVYAVYQLPGGGGASTGTVIFDKRSMLTVSDTANVFHTVPQDLSGGLTLDGDYIYSFGNPSGTNAYVGRVAKR